jgi:exonuclease III
LKIGVFNAQSIRNKALMTMDLTLEHDLDVVAISETWLREEESAVVAEIKPPGYDFYHVARQTIEDGPARRGGGVGILIRSSLKHEVIQRRRYDSFEAIEMMIRCGNNSIRLINIYRPQRLPGDVQAPWNTFLTDFENFLAELTSSPGKLLLVGDMNVAANKDDDPHVRAYNQILQVNNMLQHVGLPTHVSKNTLDHICTKENEDVLQPSSIRIEKEAGNLSDHAFLVFETSDQKPIVAEKKRIKYRRWPTLDKDSLRRRLSEGLATINAADPHALVAVSHLCEQLLNEMVPLKTKMVSGKDKPPWYSHDLYIERAKRRKLERTWRRTRTASDYRRYKDQENAFKTLLHDTRKQHYEGRIQEQNGNQRGLYSIINTLLDRKKVSKLPRDGSEQELAERFSDYFVSKISKIREDIIASTDDVTEGEPTEVINAPPAFTSFTYVTADLVVKMIRSSPLKQCQLDALPTWLMKELAETIAPFLTSVINKSLERGEVPETLKKAIITPALKKPTADVDDLKNYRPISNINFIGKLLEKVVDAQLRDHLQPYNLLEPLQSAYR